jgi:hypothetical protein
VERRGEDEKEEEKEERVEEERQPHVQKCVCFNP